jgi:hypothetical protein
MPRRRAAAAALLPPPAAAGRRWHLLAQVRQRQCSGCHHLHCCRLQLLLPRLLPLPLLPPLVLLSFRSVLWCPRQQGWQ